jgi:hypothetical protein
VKSSGTDADRQHVIGAHARNGRTWNLPAFDRGNTPGYTKEPLIKKTEATSERPIRAKVATREQGSHLLNVRHQSFRDRRDSELKEYLAHLFWVQAAVAR